MSSKIEVALSASTLAVLSLATIVLCASITIATVSVHSPHRTPRAQDTASVPRPGDNVGPSRQVGTMESKEVMDAKYGPINHAALKEEKHGIFRNIAQRRQGAGQCQTVYSQQYGYCYQQQRSYRPTYPIASGSLSCVPCRPTQVAQPYQPARVQPCIPCQPRQPTPTPSPVPARTPDSSGTRLTPYTPHYPLLPEINSSCKNGKCTP